MQANDFQQMKSNDRIFSELLAQVVTVTAVLERNRPLLDRDLQRSLHQDGTSLANARYQVVTIADRPQPLMLFAGAADRVITKDTLVPLTRCRHPLPVGFTLFTLRGEMDTDEDADRLTPPMALGKITDHMRARCGQRTCYSYDVVFPSTGGWVIIDDHEIMDPSQYLGWADRPFPKG